MEDHHAIFYMMHGMGKPVFTNEVSTASVSFDKEGDFVKFSFNPDFWHSLSRYEKKFVISHECLHVILNHGLRSRGTQDPRQANVAMDLVVNHTLVSRFKFDREQISGWEKYCWTETVFPKQNVQPGQTFEAYMQLLQTRRSNLPDTVDEHDDNEWDEVIGKLNENLSNEEKKTIQDIIEQHSQSKDGRGTGAGNGWYFADTSQVKKKRKWETVIKQWSRKYLKPKEESIEQWARLNRRLAAIDTDLILPSDMDDDKPVEGKIEVWFFQDTSGSCCSFRDRFFAAAKSLPEDRFLIRMFCFDTCVYETSLQSGKLYGFGGTSFSIIEEHIQDEVRKGSPYPEAVFVITDGAGNAVNPRFPEKWYWFLSANYRHCIPQKSNVYMLRDYE
jgi:hypothetical protein